MGLSKLKIKQALIKGHFCYIYNSNNFCEFLLSLNNKNTRNKRITSHNKSKTEQSFKAFRICSCYFFLLCDNVENIYIYIYIYIYLYGP
jgi:hypothetical protein